VTIAYFDASALVKLFLDELGSSDALKLWNGADTIFASRVAETEVRAALAAARRANRLGSAAHAEAAEQWVRVRDSIRFVEFTPALARLAGEIAEVHELGSLDAIHLVSAMLLAEDELVVATWDIRLLAAARSVGIATLPPG
jgi:uncharacterized protein